MYLFFHNVTHGMLNIFSKFHVPTSNGLKGYFVWRSPYNHMLYPISFHFHFVEIFDSYPNWVTFYWVFSFGQHLLRWKGLLPFALWKMPSYNHLQNALIKMPFSKRALWIEAFCQVIYEGISRDQMRNALLLCQECPSIFLDIMLLLYILKKGIL